MEWIWLVDDEARIALQVVQVSCAGADIRLDNATTALPAFAIPVVAKFQADEIGILKGKLAGQTRNGVIMPRLGSCEFDAAQ